VTPQQFAHALAECLGPLVPEGFAVRAEGEHVQVQPPEGPPTSASLGHLDPAEASADDYADAAWTVLSMVQDAVSEQVVEAWPAGGGDTLADPGVRVEGGVLHLWYGEEGRPALTLPTLPLA
jgi:hypothetical protein